MKKILGLFIVLFICPNGLCEDSRWWQREELKPSTNQIINSDYLSKRRELEIVWDQKNNALKAFEYFSSKKQNISAIRESIADIEKQVQKLEMELKNISPYLSLTTDSKTDIGIEKSSKTMDSLETLKTFGHAVMFRLDLSDWSTQKLVDFSNVFDTTQGAHHFGIRILPQSFVLETIKSLDELNKITGGNLSWSSYQVMFTEYVPKTWPNDKMQRRSEILKLEEGLLRGKPVFIPLLYDGDEVSIRLPKGIYFLNYTVHMNFPTRNQPFTDYGFCGSIEKCTVGPYFVEVTGEGQNVITYAPKPYPITLDELNMFFARLEQIGVDSLILKSFSNIAANQIKEQLQETKETQPSEKPLEKIYVRCLSCGKLNPEDANFCQNCGKKMVPNDSGLHN
jgi:hypothetical protein